MTPEKWERIARLLKAGPVSDRAAARQLGVRAQAVAAVRWDLGVPPFQRQRRQGWTQADFDEFAVPVRGGHKRWRGRTTDGVPRAGTNRTAYQLAFRLHHGREPVGPVWVVCQLKRCVEGAHLEDGVMRSEAVAPGDPRDLSGLTELPSAATWRGLDVVAVRAALGEKSMPPYPPLNPQEQRLGFRFRPAGMSFVELAVRLGLHPKTLTAWRNREGAA